MNIFCLGRLYKRSIMRSMLVGLLLSMSFTLSADEKSKLYEKNESHNEAKSYSKSKKEKQDKKQEIMQEISFLAKKLLDMSGEKSVVVTSPAVIKPFIGVCSNIENKGVRLTCITPDSQADKNGLKTGDLITSINDVSMNKEGNKEHVYAYWDVVKNMDVGDVLKIELIRAGTTLEIDVTVGSLSHPAYTLEVKR